MNLKKYELDIKDELLIFINKIPSMMDVDMAVLESASILYDENDIKGLICYEEFDDAALIRYFIFRREVHIEELKRLFYFMKDRIINDLPYIKKIISVVESSFLQKLFETFGFKAFTKGSFFIDEEKITTKEALIMTFDCY